MTGPPIPARWAAGLLRRAPLALAFWAATAALAAWLLAHFRIDPDVASLFPKDDPTLRLTRHFQGDASPTRALLVVLRADDAASIDAAIPAVVEELRKSPHLLKVLASRQEFAGARADWFARAPLTTLPEPALDRLQAVLAGPERKAAIESSRRLLEEDPIAGKQRVLQDPLGLRWVYDEAAAQLSGRFPVPLRAGSPWLVFEKPALAFLRAVGRDDSYKVDFSERLLENVRARLAAALGGGPVRTELAGGYVSAVAHASAMRRDMIQQTILSSVLVMLFLTWLTRSLLAPFLLLVPVIFSIVCGLAFGGAILGPLTPLVVSVAAVLVAQPIDFSLHFFERFRAERRDHPRNEAILRSLGSLSRPFMGAALATMTAFLMLALTSRFTGFVHFGFLLLVGMAALLLTSLTLFPILLLGMDRFIRPAAETTPLVVAGMARLSGRPSAVLFAALGLAAWATVAFGTIRIDLDVRNMMAPGDPGQEVLNRLEHDLGVSLTPVCALLPEDASLEDVRRGLASLRASGTLRFADGPHELFPSPARVDRAARFLRETEGWIEGTLRDLASAGFRPELFRDRLAAQQARLAAPPPSSAWLREPEFAPLLNAFYYPVDGRLRQVFYLFPSQSLWRPEERSVFDATVRTALGHDIRFLSGFHLPDHYSQLLSRDLLRVAACTALLVIVCTISAIGSFADGLRALVPVVVATGVTLVTCVFLGGAINLMNMVAIPIILGTGVDGGIHFVARLREDPRRDPRRALREVGSGVWGSAMTTILGFGAIGSSVTPGLSSMGVLVVVGTLAALGSTFYLLPALFRARNHPV